MYDNDVLTDPTVQGKFVGCILPSKSRVIAVAFGDIGHTVLFLSFRTDRSGQTVQTQIRLLLEEQSDQGLHCLPFRLHRLDSLLCGRATEFKF